MFDKVLKSGRKVKIKELSEDQIADLKDIPEVYLNSEEKVVYRKVNKAHLAWLRCGIGGGDFDDWKPNGVAPPDHVLRQLTEEERVEIVLLVKECQTVNPKKPSNLG